MSKTVINQFLETSSTRLQEAVKGECSPKLKEMSSAGSGGAEGAPMMLDLGVKRRGELNESTLSQFGSQIEMMLSTMFGSGMLPAGIIRGTRSEIDAFGKTLGGEKMYASAYEKYGLNDPRTYGSKYALDRAIRNFEQETGLKWPVK